jgi:hypothetical protein
MRIIRFLFVVTMVVVVCSKNHNRPCYSLAFATQSPGGVLVCGGELGSLVLWHVSVSQPPRFQRKIDKASSTDTNGNDRPTVQRRILSVVVQARSRRLAIVGEGSDSIRICDGVTGEEMNIATADADTSSDIKVSSLRCAVFWEVDSR